MDAEVVLDSQLVKAVNRRGLRRMMLIDRKLYRLSVDQTGTGENDQRRFGLLGTSAYETEMRQALFKQTDAGHPVAADGGSYASKIQYDLLPGDCFVRDRNLPHVANDQFFNSCRQGVTLFPNEEGNVCV